MVMALITTGSNILCVAQMFLPFTTCHSLVTCCGSKGEKLINNWLQFVVHSHSPSVMTIFDPLFSSCWPAPSLLPPLSLLPIACFCLLFNINTPRCLQSYKWNCSHWIQCFCRCVMFILALFVFKASHAHTQSLCLLPALSVSCVTQAH